MQTLLHGLGWIGTADRDIWAVLKDSDAFNGDCGALFGTQRPTRQDWETEKSKKNKQGAVLPQLFLSSVPLPRFTPIYAIRPHTISSAAYQSRNSTLYF